MNELNSTKLIYYLSVFSTIASFGTMAYGYYTTDLITIVMMLPIFTLFYPIALIGTVVFGIKRVLKSKSVFELIQMAGMSGKQKPGGLAGLMGVQTEEKEQEEQKE